MSSPNPESSGPPLRALAMVLISLAILFAAIGALSLSGSDSDSEEAAPDATSEVAEGPDGQASGSAASAPQAPAASATPEPEASVDPSDVDVLVLNNSNVSGLAADTASTLTAQGWTIVETGNYVESQIPTTTVFYGSASSAQAAAQEIAQQLGVSAQAAPATVSAYSDGVVVVVTE
ncbi:LytR C-terminal domain-containing protein [Rhodococcoides yunnanense]|nr:LytR C-terminal domain-containing protein [Rhodococcus yunnanensis]MCZ4276550.1 LytR C-terminal domain-containing protein [Rhodococcus yunnanensis]